jgi:hypothetical protein
MSDGFSGFISYRSPRTVIAESVSALFAIAKQRHDNRRYMCILPSHSVSLSHTHTHTFLYTFVKQVYQFMHGGLLGAAWGMVTPFPVPGSVAAAKGK